MRQRILSLPSGIIVSALVLLAAVAIASTATAGAAADSSVEPFRSPPGPGFFGWSADCLSGRDPCVGDRELPDTFLLQYVQLSLTADPGDGCQGEARIVVDLDPGTLTIGVLEIEVADNGNDTTTVVLPSPVRMRAGEKLEAEASNHLGGERAT